jgi:hypothetical protein
MILAKEPSARGEAMRAVVTVMEAMLIEDGRYLKPLAEAAASLMKAADVTEVRPHHISSLVVHFLTRRGCWMSVLCCKPVSCIES